MQEKQLQSNVQIARQPSPTSLVKHDPSQERRILLSDYLDKFGLISNRVATPSMRKLYEETLADLSLSRLQAGLEGWLRNGDRWPWPSDIREAAEL